MASDITEETVEAWLTGHAHTAYAVAVGVLGGGQQGHLIAGNAALFLFLVITAMSVRFLYREFHGVAEQVWGIAVSLLKVLVAAVLVAFLCVWTARLYWFVYPSGAHTRAKESVSKQVWWAATWLQRAWQWGTETSQ